MAEKAFLVKLNIKSSKTADRLKEIVSALPGFQISTNGTPDYAVLFLEIGHDLDEEFRLVEQIREKGGIGLFLTSASKDPDVLLRAMKAGVREFFPQPINPEDISASLLKFRQLVQSESEYAKEKNGTVIGVVGSKGGVGSTTVAVNLAVSLRETAPEKSVCFVDMNPILGGANLFMDVRTSFSWAQAVRDISRMDSTYLFNTLYKHSSGVHVLPAPERAVDLDAATPETLEKLIRVIKSSFDLIIVDACKCFDDVSLRAIALTDTLLLVTELNILSIVNAKKLLDSFENHGILFGKDIKAVINRYEKQNMVSPGEAEKTLGRKIVTMIPNDYGTVMNAINAGKPVSETAKKSGITEQFSELAAVLLHREIPKKQKFGFSFNSFKLIGQR